MVVNIALFGTLEKPSKAGIIIKDSQISSLKNLQKVLFQEKIEQVYYQIDSAKWLDQMIKFKIPTVIFGAEYHNQKDHMKQPNSGLDTPLVQRLKDKEIKYGFDLDALQEATNSKNARLILPRIKQNKYLLKKVNCKPVLFTAKNSSDLLFNSL